MTMGCQAKIEMTHVLALNTTTENRVTPLICTLKSDFEGVTWDFLGHELEKYRVGTTQIFFWFTLWNPAFSQVATLKKFMLDSTLPTKAPIFSKLKIGCRLEGRVCTLWYCFPRFLLWPTLTPMKLVAFHCHGLNIFECFLGKLNDMYFLGKLNHFF